MGIGDAFGMDGIRRLFEDSSFVARPLSRASIVKYISSQSSRRQVEGARSLVSRMQCGEDLSELCNDVIKVIDTRNAEFKRLLNVYLIKYTRGWPAKQLICINTVLKDFGDDDCGLRHSAIQDSGLLGDGGVIRNYVNPLKAHGASKSAETRRKVADSLRNYFLADPKLFCSEGLCDLLKTLAFDEDAGVCGSAVSTIRVVEQEMRVLSADEVCKLLRLCIMRGVQEALVCVLEVMASRAEDFSDPSPLLPLLRSRDVRVFHLASRLVVSIDCSYRQEVFEHLTGFLFGRDEELYLVLDYAESLLEHVRYDNSWFAIHGSDSKYNKMKKLKLLFKRLDGVSVAEIRSQCRDTELLGMILREALRADYLIEEPFRSTKVADEVIRELYDADLISEKWDGLIREFLADARHVGEKQKYIYLCGRYVHEIPPEVVEIQGQGIQTLTNEIIRFYLNLHRRGVLGLDEVLEHLHPMQKSSKDRVRAVISDLKARGAGVFGPFSSIKRKERDGPRIAMQMVKEKGPESILDVKPYYGLEGSRFAVGMAEKVQKELSVGDRPLVESECLSFGREGGECISTTASPMVDENMLPHGCAPSSDQFLDREENVWLRFAESQRAGGHKDPGRADESRLVDTNGLKGILTIADGEVVLQVDVVEAPLVIYCECKGRLSSVRVDREGVFSLLRINLSLINSMFRMTISKSAYEVRLGIRSLMQPVECSKDEFERKFREIEDHICLKELATERTQGVGSHSFVFSVLGAKFYGKRVDGQVILKGSRRLLGLF